MEKSKYEENARKIINLVDGMTEAQWSRVQLIINFCFSEKKAKVTFEKPVHLKNHPEILKQIAKESERKEGKRNA